MTTSTKTRSVPHLLPRTVEMEESDPDKALRGIQTIETDSDPDTVIREVIDEIKRIFPSFHNTPELAAALRKLESII